MLPAHSISQCKSQIHTTKCAILTHDNLFQYLQYATHAYYIHNFEYNHKAIPPPFFFVNKEKYTGKYGNFLSHDSESEKLRTDVHLRCLQFRCASILKLRFFSNNSMQPQKGVYT